MNAFFLRLSTKSKYLDYFVFRIEYQAMCLKYFRNFVQEGHLPLIPFHFKNTYSVLPL